jgi:hypothetical protein
MKPSGENNKEKQNSLLQRDYLDWIRVGSELIEIRLSLDVESFEIGILRASINILECWLHNEALLLSRQIVHKIDLAVDSRPFSSVVIKRRDFNEWGFVDFSVELLRGTCAEEEMPVVLE